MGDFTDWCKENGFSTEEKVPPPIDIIYPKLYNAIPFLCISTPIDGDNFWKILQENLAPLKQDIPDPATNFDQFLHFLYDHLSILKPSKIEDCIEFVHLFSSTPLSKFFFTIFPHSLKPVDFFISQVDTNSSEEAPRSLDLIPTQKKYRPIDPQLYSKSSFNLAVQTYYQLIKNKDPLWVQLCNEEGGISTLFGLYLPSLTLTDNGEFLLQFWEYRLELSSLMVNLITKYVDSVSMANDFILSLNSQLLNLLFSSPDELSLNFARIIVQLNMVSLPRIRPENAARRLTNILNSAPSGTISHNYILRFILTNGAQYITPESVISTLIKQGIFSSQDLEVLVRFASIKPPTPVKKTTKKQTKKNSDQSKSDSQNPEQQNNESQTPADENSTEEEESPDKEPDNENSETPNDNSENTKENSENSNENAETPNDNSENSKENSENAQVENSNEKESQETKENKEKKGNGKKGKAKKVVPKIIDNSAQYQVIKYLSFLSVVDNLWGQTAASLLALLVYRIHIKGYTTPSTEAYLRLFVQRQFMFVGLSNAKKKYRGHVIRALEALSNDKYKLVPWLNQCILDNAAKLKGANINDPIVNALWKVAPITDSNWSTEYENIKAENPPLKRFPFSQIGRELYQLPLKKGIKRKIPTAKVSTKRPPWQD